MRKCWYILVPVYLPFEQSYNVSRLLENLHKETKLRIRVLNNSYRMDKKRRKYFQATNTNVRATHVWRIYKGGYSIPLIYA